MSGVEARMGQGTGWATQCNTTTLYARTDMHSPALAPSVSCN